MQAIIHRSLDLAIDDATVLWGMTSSIYPAKHDLLINKLSLKILELVSNFALNCRRILEQFPKHKKFRMCHSRWIWKLSDDGRVITDLWEATNYIIHAKELYSGIESLPENLSFIKGKSNSTFIPYIKVRTDRKDFAYIDVFSMTHCFLYDVIEEFNLLLESES